MLAKSRIYGLAAAITLILMATLVVRVRDLLSPVSFPASRSPDAMERYFSSLIATDCGRVSIQGNPVASTSCAIDNFRNKQAFFVRYDLQGVAVGIASDGDGHVYELAYESMGDILSTKSCPHPVKLTTTLGGWLTCFPDDTAIRTPGVSDRSSKGAQ